MNSSIHTELVPVIAAQAIIPPPVSHRHDPDSWEFWLPRWAARKAETTRIVYRQSIVGFLDFIGWKPVSTVLTTDIEAWQQLLCNRKLAPNTVARQVASVCSLCSFIYRRDSRVMPTNPGAAVERIKATNDIASRILSEAEVLRLIDRTEHKRDRALLRVLYSAGLRISEAVRLRWTDIVWREQDALLTVLGKGGRTRTVAIYGAAIDALQAILPPAGRESTDFCFKTVHGGLSRIYAVQLVRKAARRAGIKKAVSPHWLRHASATHSLERGAPLPLVSKTLGHQNLSVTGRYLHVRPTESMGKYLAI